MRALILAFLLPFLATLTGCNIVGGVVGNIMAKQEREGSHNVDAEYRGLVGKSYAVLVTAPAVIQASRPALAARVAVVVTETLQEHSGATGFVPGPRIIEYQYNRPNWVAKPLGEVAKDLGVDRIIFVDISEYRLRDPGNQYVWEGVASALVGVVEADTSLPDDMIFQKRIEVKFPDAAGYTPTDLPEGAVNTELTRRLSDRIAWLFYTHEEPNIIKY
ncbi:MAG: hypothetical protein Q8L55_06440 [Phycisphaerales bacterium]|nr:hypothetical protein [Phycisphaerales bacterium]